MKNNRMRKAKFLANMQILPIIISLIFGIIVYCLFPSAKDYGIRITPHSFISNYQTFQCQDDHCYITYYKDTNDNTYECNMETDDTSLSDLEVKETRVYYNGRTCYLTPVDLSGINGSIIFELLFLLPPIVVIIFAIRTMKENRNIYKTLEYFESHTPTLFRCVKCYSKQNVSFNEKCHHNIKVELDLPGHGLTTLERKLTSPKSLIEEVDVLIDLNDISMFYITDIPISESELESFNENKTEV